ncbi:MAG: TldD/PmbA family protein [Candidatus Bathyarchaeota archaeon]
MAELSSEELFHLGKRAIKNAMEKGADEAEAFLTETLGTSVAIERGQITKNMRKKGQGLAIRVVYRKAVGFSYTNMFNEKSVMQTANEAFQSARASRPDKSWPGFPTPKKYSTPKDTYDKKVAAISSGELVDIASRILDETASYDKRVLAAFGSVEASVSSKAVVNSYGLEAFDKGTSIGCVLGTVARDGDEVTPICVEFSEERLYKILPETVGREAARQAISSLKSRKIDSGNFTTVFGQIALCELLYYTFINAVKADQVQREQSALKGKIGQKVASNLISVYDDGLMTRGLRTWKFDDEGIPRRKTTIIEKGILRHYLYDFYAAEKDGTVSTGNALRIGQMSYMSTPVIEATNFALKEGNRSPDSLIGEVEDGILVLGFQGAHSSNPSTGEFSVVATPAWKIDKGEITYAIKGAMLAGSVFDVLNNISVIGNNSRKIRLVVTPWIRAENIRVIGK